MAEHHEKAKAITGEDNVHVILEPEQEKGHDLVVAVFGNGPKGKAYAEAFMWAMSATYFSPNGAINPGGIDEALGELEDCIGMLEACTNTHANEEGAIDEQIKTAKQALAACEFPKESNG